MPYQPVQYELPPAIGRPLQPAWPTGIAAQHIVLTHFADMLGWRQAVLEINLEEPRPEDIEAVHGIRVASRRTRTALRTFAALWPEHQSKPIHRQVSDITEAFGMARDLDVMCDYLRGELAVAAEEHQPRLQAALSNTLLFRMYEQDKLIATVVSLDESGFIRDFIDHFSMAPFNLWELEGAGG